MEELIEMNDDYYSGAFRILPIGDILLNEQGIRVFTLFINKLENDVSNLKVFAILTDKRNGNETKIQFFDLTEEDYGVFEKDKGYATYLTFQNPFENMEGITGNDIVFSYELVYLKKISSEPVLYYQG